MPSARPYARCPLSRAGKEIILDDDTTDVGVDAVLSADVGDAPMRQRQYSGSEVGSASVDLNDRVRRESVPRSEDDDWRLAFPNQDGGIG